MEQNLCPLLFNVTLYRERGRKEYQLPHIKEIRENVLALLEIQELHPATHVSTTVRMLIIIGIPYKVG